MKLTFSDNKRQILFAMIQILTVSITSVSLTLSNQPNLFGQFGGFVVVYSLLSISLHRVRYENYLRQLQDDWIATVLNYRENQSQIKAREDALASNMHTLQISIIAKHVGITDDFIVLSRDETNEVEGRVKLEQALRRERKEKKQELYDKLNKYREEYKTERDRSKGWARITWRLEVAFVSIGTIMNAYGAGFVTWFHK